MLGRRDLWLLDPAVTFLNHGSYGACPRPILEAQSRWRARMESQPVAFLERNLTGFLEQARAEIAAFVGADADELVFVPNATTGINVVVRALALTPGDEILTTDHAYGAVLHTLQRRCDEAGARLVVVPVPLPFPSEEAVAAALVESIGERTRLVVVDHVSSSTAAVFPVQMIVERCRARGVPVFVDAAHSPGMLDVDLRALGADFWVGNFHKWMCAPKGAAVLAISSDHRAAIRPLVTSHAYLDGFQMRFDWPGTHDPTPYLTIPDAIAFMNDLGWDELRVHNAELVRAGRDTVRAAMGAEQLVRDDATPWMASIALPSGLVHDRASSVRVHDAFYDRTSIEVPFFPWTGGGLLRVSAHAYNEIADYERLAQALPAFVTESMARVR